MMLISLQRFLTCEGRYVVTFLYHLKLLLHFEGGAQIDFPYFLWMSLNKMVRGVKSTSKKPKNSIHHHGLVKLLVVHGLRKQGNSWKQLLQQKFSQEGVSKSIEEHETKACSEGSSRKTKERKIKGKKLGDEKDVVTPSSSQPVDRLDKDNSVMIEEPTASNKKRTSQSQKPSPALIHETKLPRSKRNQRNNSRKGELSDSAPEEAIELSLQLVSKLEGVHEINIQIRRKFQKKDVLEEQIPEDPTTSRKERSSQYKEQSPTLIPKIQLPQSERQKMKKYGQNEVSYETPEETIEFPQESVSKLERNPKVKSGSR
jgi:hypothetical protein